MAYFKNYQEVKRYLFGLKYHGAKYGIERMAALSAALGYPEHEFPVIHVAGTNGKGSTCAMLEAVYRNCGLKTGLYSSPHLVYQGERIQVNRKLFSNEAIVAHTEQIKIIAEELARHDPDDHPSFFEFMTAMAFRHFAAEKVDIGIIETGLGGRLDATNVVDPELTVITSISLDHTELLGETIAAIATEKAGIIKPGKPVVIGCLPPAAEAVIQSVAQERQAPFYRIADHFGKDKEDWPSTNMAGACQRRNAAIALLVSRILSHKFSINDEQARQALQHVAWAARWDRHTVGDKTVILDNSHNPEGALVLQENLEELVAATGRKPIIVVGTMGVHRAAALMPVVCRYAREVILVRPTQQRATTFDDMKLSVPKEFKANVRWSTTEKLFPFAGCCSEGESGDVLVATGSIYLMGEIMEALYHDLPVGDRILQDTP